MSCHLVNQSSFEAKILERNWNRHGKIKSVFSDARSLFVPTAKIC